MTRIFSIILLIGLFSNTLLAQTINVCKLDTNQDKTYRLDVSHNANEIIFSYKNCHLDLSEFTYMAFDIINKSNKRLIVDISYQGPQKRHVNQGRFFISKYKSNVNKLILNRMKLPDSSSWMPYFKNVRGLPGGYVRHWNAFDLTKIKSVRIKISSNETLKETDSIFVKLPFGDTKLEFSGDSFANQELPILDEIGQSVSKTWEGKLKSKRSFKKIGVEDYKKYSNGKFSNHLTKYGGFTSGPKLEAKGFFYTQKYKGKWWFVDPEGYLFWSQGITGVGRGSATSTRNRNVLFPPLETERKTASSEEEELFFKNQTINFYDINLKHKYGSNWQKKHAEVTIGRMKSWGVNTSGAWSEASIQKNHPYTLIIHPSKQGIGNIAKMVDPFSQDFKNDLLMRAKWLVKHKNNPWLLGVFVNNELHWKGELEIPFQVLQLKNSVPARKAMENLLEDKYVSIEKLNTSWGSDFSSFQKINNINKNAFTNVFIEDMKAYLDLFADTYFKTVAKVIKNILPNHLYFGSRFHEEVKYNKVVQKAASRYCDVISFNIYEYGTTDFKVHTEVDKPAIIGEFHFGTGSHGVWGTGLRSASNLENQAALYEQYILEAAKHPSFIGAHWFQWSDQPATGRGSDGENFRIGLVNISDQPYQKMVEAIKKSSKNLYNTRIK